MSRLHYNVWFVLSLGNNLDQSMKKKKSDPASDCRKPIVSSGGAAGTSGLGHQRNITKLDSSDPDLPPSYSVS